MISAGSASSDLPIPPVLASSCVLDRLDPRIPRPSRGRGINHLGHPRGRTRGMGEAAGAEERLQRGLELSFAYLNRRERSEQELRAQLERKGVSADTADTCLTELTAQGYVDDGRYALMFVHDKRELEGWGNERIRRGLTERGIGRDRIEAALADHEAQWAGGETELD